MTFDTKDIIVLIIVAMFILFIIFPPTIYVYIPNNYNDLEQFESNEYPGDSVINNIASKYAEKITIDTYNKVVAPCIESNTTTKINNIQCIAKYDNYFNEILKEYIIDIYTKLKQLNGSYVDFIAEITTRGQYDFALVISDAYANAMSATLTELKTNHNESLDKNIFQSIMINELAYRLVVVLKKVFGKKTKLIVKPKHQIQKNIKRVDLTCDDLQNKIAIYVDNNRILCKKNN